MTRAPKTREGTSERLQDGCVMIGWQLLRLTNFRFRSAGRRLGASVARSIGEIVAFGTLTSGMGTPLKTGSGTFNMYDLATPTPSATGGLGVAALAPETWKRASDVVRHFGTMD